MKTFVKLICSAFMIILAFAGSTVQAQNKPTLSAGQAIVEAIRIKPPLAFCGEPVPLSDPEIRERLERELLVSLDDSDSVILWLKRSNRYFPHIEKVLREESMPDDLKYITIAESSLRPLAFSNKGAAGYWQFIESTGTKYGLEVSNDIDERRNFYRATQAAVGYLKELYALFGSWTLAAAAYNMGEDGLKSEMLVQQENNYYRLYLNQETQRYVFRILAAKIIISNPARFGYALAPDDLYSARRFEIVEIKAVQPVPLHILAQAANTTFKTIKDLNPQIKYYHLPSGACRLAVPPGSSAGFAWRYEKLFAEWLKTRNDFVYTVKRGDTLTGIAARFNVPYRALLIWNRLSRGSKIFPGDKLYIFSNDFKTGNLSSPAANPAPPEPAAPEFDPADSGP
ncbi:MAG: transglycosylase SLT domain-containing protein [Smithellaceae bacterium]|nr:transglycosylase SLT domain-containing protein [Syntrophaceae bacterium]MDD4241837.1 transglycosylase SLT domain-containing protein [Smithellaceae bacterium]